MRDWIYKLIALLPAYLAIPASLIADRLWGVYDDGVRFAQHIRDGVITLRDRILYYVDKVESFAAEVDTTLYWAIRKYIPLYVSGLVNDGIHYVLGIVHSAENAVLLRVNALELWARHLINTALGDLFTFRDYIVGKVDGLLSDLAAVKKLAATLLTSPGDMADWLVAAMAQRLLRYAYSRREDIAAFILSDTPAMTRIVALVIERILKDLL